MRAQEFLIRESEKPKVGRAFQHAEDLVIVDGSQGAFHALDQLAAMATTVDDVTIKWDGSPGIYFGRNDQGEFVLTDKSGFTAKGYNGRVTSATDLANMLLSRGKTEPTDERKQFAAAMASLWDRFENIVSPSFRGFVYGDLLYHSRPPVENREFVFTPNTVTYEIPVDSELGQRIAKSTTGIVVHSYRENAEANENPIRGSLKGIDSSQEVMVVGPMTVAQVPTIDSSEIKRVKQFVEAHATEIDTLLDDQWLASNKLSDFKALLYKFVNQQVPSKNLSQLDKRFDQWLESSGVSANKITKIQELRQTKPQAFAAVFDTLEMIMKIKDDIIDQLDLASPVKSSIQGQRGGEGYVKGNIKLVPRTKFTAANIEKHA